MKHCLIMTAYKDVGQINRIVKHTPSSWGVYIHIDKKSSIPVSEINPRAIVLKKNKIYWGSIRHLETFLELLDMAKNAPEEYDYFHLITGQDFYSCSPKKFDNIINAGDIYMEVHPCPRANWWGGDMTL